MSRVICTYLGKSGEDYTKSRGHHLPDHLEYVLQAKLFVPHLRFSDSVLDFGCGSGKLATELRPSVASIEGLEVNDYAAGLARAAGLTVYRSLAEISEARQYSVIVSSHVLEHVPDPVETLSEIATKMQPNGKLLLLLPIDDFRCKRQQFTRHLIDPNHHLYTWTPLSLANTLKASGFKPLAVSVVACAYSRRFSWLGDTPFQRLACWFVAVANYRRQLFSISEPTISVDTLLDNC